MSFNANMHIVESNGGNGAQSPSPPPQTKAPRQHSVRAANDPRNATDYREDQAHWSWENLPEILYTFKPPPIARQSEPDTLPYQIHGQFLRNLPVLPDRISSDVEEFRVEAWMRLDRRVRLVDITQRMHPEFRIKENALQQRGVRFRKAFNMLAWGSGNRKTLQTEAELVNEMLNRGIDPNMNSTRGMTPGLIQPEFGEAGGRIPIPEQYIKRSMQSNWVMPQMPQKTSVFRGFDNNIAPAVFKKENIKSFDEDDKFQEPNTLISVNNNADEEVETSSDDMECDMEYEPSSDEEGGEEVDEGVDEDADEDVDENPEAPNEDMDIEMDNNMSSVEYGNNNSAKDDIVETIIILPDTPSSFYYTPFSFYDSPRTPVLVPDSPMPKPHYGWLPEPSPTIYPKLDIFPDDRSQEIANLFDSAMHIYYMRDAIMMGMRCWYPNDDC